MYTDGIRFKDDSHRTLLLRGVNLGGSSKIPYSPNGATHLKDSYYDHAEVSFVGRPFPLEEADRHFQRLQSWGLTFVRFLITWEAVEHAGPGLYDEQYLTYLYQVIKKAAKYDIAVFIDPHQDVWSRFTGGDGAPGWTLEAIGMEPSRLNAAGAAICHQEHGDPFPRMIWPSNTTKLAAATLFTLFFGGDDFAPLTLVDGQPVQQYLQGHYINAVKQVATRLQGLSNVVGYDTLNEPTSGYIGIHDLTSNAQLPFRIGPCPTPFQAMALGCGHAQTVDVFEYGSRGTQCIGPTRIDPEGITIWRKGIQCVWQENGVWSDQGGTPQLLKPGHFTMAGGRKVDFERDYLKPFCLRFINEIRQVQPKAIIFLENFPGKECLEWGDDDPPDIVNATHWYDGRTLLTKQYTPPELRGRPAGDDAVGLDDPGHLFESQLGHIKQMAQERMGGVPTLIGEFGLPFDMNDKDAYQTGDFSVHVQALDAYFSAMEHHLLNATLWNYTADNDNGHGDQWNGEDLSIFSRDQQTDPEDINSGGRALQAVVRPYPRKIAGTPVAITFDLDSRRFAFEFDPVDNAVGPTELFVPVYQYPDGYEVVMSAGSYKKNSEDQILSIVHSGTQRHRVEVYPAAT